MGKLVFKLRNVPDDEADAIRALLHENRIGYYETSAGNWGIATPAIWLEDAGDFERARRLIDAYESERSEAQRAHFSTLKAAGKQKTLADAIRDNPLQVLLYIAFALFILYVSLVPFFEFGK